MSTTEWFKYSIFSNLSYVRWDGENSASGDDQIGAAVDARRLPASIAGRLFKGLDPWTIPSFHPNDDSGFAANVFRNDDEVVLAIRGTEANLLEALPFVGETGWVDLLDADIADIGLVGFALDQTVSLVNYVMRLKGAVDTNVTQVGLHTITLSAGIDPGISQPYFMVPGGLGGFTLNTYYWLEEIAAASGLGILDVESNASVTGHSLGGHLAVMAIRLFPELFDQAITFNAPGFDPLTSKELTDQFVNLFGEFLSLSPADTFADIAGRITAIESESSEPGDDLSGVASLFTGIPVGQEVLIHTENNSHSMDQLMDALAVHSLVATLNPTLDVDQLLHFYDGMSLDAGATEETLVTALAKVILGEEPTLEQVEAGIISHGDFADRVQIHDQVVDIQNEVLARGLVLEPVWDKTPEELAALAKNSMAYRYAILNLDPFVVLGDESLYLEMSGASPFITDAHSEAYWLARSEMLLAKFNLGLTDGEMGDIGELVAVYTDLPAGVEVSAMATGVDMPLQTIFVGEQGTGFQVMSGSDEAESIFGGIGADRLAGGEGSDIIDGGGGSDVLIAGESIGSSDDGVVDRLEGGAGADFYYVGNGDVISDSDRLVAGIVLSGWSVSVTYEWISEGVFQSADGSRILEIVGDTALITLTNLATPSILTIQDFSNPGLGFRDGEFGISLVMPEDVELPASTFHIIGTVNSDNPWEEGDDVVSLTGTDGSEGIAGLEGDDFIYSMHGVDFVDAGPGDDVVMNVDAGWETPDPGGDTFIGGPGNDALTGNAGGDWLLGADGDDFIQGGGGVDLLSGGSGNELIFGGDGDDIIYGDSGNDIVDGDKSLIDLDVREWLQEGGLGLGLSWLGLESIEPSIYGESYGGDRIWGGSGSDYLLGGVGDDKIYGGPGIDTLVGGFDTDNLFGEAGADTLRGGYGDDFMDGGSETDFIFGDEGDDELKGGDGDDRLAGGPGEDVLMGGLGNDRYDYSPGDGWDRIREVQFAPGANNSILFDLGDYFGFYEVVQSGTDLVIQHLEDDAGIIVEGWFIDPESILDEVHFNDRTWNIDDLAALAAGQGTRWNDWLYGSEEDDWFQAGNGEDYGFGGSGDDTIFGGAGADTLIGDAGNDSLYGGDGPDFIDGGSGDDFIVAGGNSLSTQVDSLWGGEGSDTYVIELGADARTYIVDTDVAGDDHDVIRLLGDARVEDLVFRQIANSGVLTNHLAVDFVPVGGGAASGITIFHWFENGGRGVDAIEFSDGSVLAAEEIIARLNVPTDGRDYLSGAGGSVTLFGLAGDDQLHGNGAKNELHGGAGADLLRASGIENILEGGDGSDRIKVSHVLPTSGDSIVLLDILLGGNGNDSLESGLFTDSETSLGTVLMDGGSGGDTLLVHEGLSMIIAGGDGFDSIAGELSATGSVILLNRGDHGDIISSTDGWGAATMDTPQDGVSHVVSFGGGITLNDISLRQDANDLLILSGKLEGLRLVDYFDLQGEAATWLTKIQIVNQATSSYESGSTSPGLSSPIMLLDFNSLMVEYVQERVGLDDAWRVVDSNSVLDAQYLSGAAFGGQVAYEYALLGQEAYSHLGDQVWTSLQGLVDLSAPVEIRILPTEPVAGVAISQLFAREDVLFQYRLPENFMVDPLTLEGLPIALVSSLPPWLTYDPLTLELSGTPGQQEVGTELVSFSATNRFGQQITVTMTLIIESAPAPEGWIITGTGRGDVLVGSEGNDSISGGAGRDELHGGSGDDRLDGGDKDDAIFGGPGQDHLFGGTGSDQLAGDDGNDVLLGGPGGDRIVGGPGDDYLSGEQGKDRLSGGEGDDVLVAEFGNDRLSGGSGDDSYEIRAGAGKVTILDASGEDAIHFGSVSSEDARFSRQQGNLVVRVDGTKAKVVVSNWFTDPVARIESIAFNDGVTLLEQDVLQLIQHRAGLATNSVSLSSLSEFQLATEFTPSVPGIGWLPDGSSQGGLHSWLP